MRLLLPLLLLFGAAHATKIVIFCIELSNSQIIWNKRVAETLATRKENDVTLVLLRVWKDFVADVSIDSSVKVKTVDAFADDFRTDLEKLHSTVIWEGGLSVAFFQRLWQTFGHIRSVMGGACEQVIQNKDFLNWLENEKFDIAFAHSYDTCPIGLIHNAKIPTWVWLNSGPMGDFVATSVGVPLIPSYISPMMIPSHAKMTLMERTRSFVSTNAIKFIFPWFLPNLQTSLFRKHISPDFPDLIDIAKTCPLVMVNSNELYELARPTLHKVVNIGGLGMQFKDAKPLKPEFQKIMDEAKGVILMSFGSVARADLMPQRYKKAFMEAFSRFPEYQFIYRYDSEDMEAFRPKNVHLFKWMPQNDLLLHNKTIGIISHGGYNSIQETLASGKPIATITLFADQLKNGKVAEFLGFGMDISKWEVSADVITEAIRKMIEDKSYGQTAKKFSQMIRKKPTKPDELLLKWTEFLAEFKTLDNMVPYGVNLNFIEYFSIDVIALLFVVPCLLFFVLRIAWIILKSCTSVVKIIACVPAREVCLTIGKVILETVTLISEIILGRLKELCPAIYIRMTECSNSVLLKFAEIRSFLSARLVEEENPVGRKNPDAQREHEE